MGQEYKVVITGSVLDGFERKDVVAAAAKLFKCTESQAETFLQGRPIPLKRKMDLKTSEQYESQLKKIGVDCEQKPINTEPVLELSSSFDEATSTPNSMTSLSLEPTVNTRADEHSDSSGLGLSDNNHSNLSLSGSPPTANTSVAPSEFECPKCATKQTKGDECIQCGIIFSKYQSSPSVNEQNDSLSQTNNDVDEFDEIAFFVGENFEKYRYKFRDLYQNDGKYQVQWHWPAFLVPLPWLIYRKLYVVAAIVFILQLVMPGILSLGISVSLGITANYIYYHHIKQRLGKITSSNDERRDDIEREGGCNSMIVTIGASMLLGVLMMFLFYQFFLSTEVEDALKKNSENNKELVAADGNPTKVKMLMLKNTVLIHKNLQAALNGSFTMPRDMKELRAVTKFPLDSTKDNWGTQMEFELSGNTMIFYSAGEDKIFDTGDDIIFETPAE